MLFLGRRHSYFCGCVCVHTRVYACLFEQSKVWSLTSHFIPTIVRLRLVDLRCTIKTHLQEALDSLRNKREAFSMLEVWWSMGSVGVRGEEGRHRSTLQVG